jgi:GGDEF domain-containing protein
MGLLEKALQFKKEINSRGEQTLIDKIQGPAETDMMDTDELEHREAGSTGKGAETRTLQTDDVAMSISDDELFRLPEDTDLSSHNEESETKTEDVSEPVIADRMETESRPSADLSSPLNADDEPPVLLKKKDLHGLASFRGEEEIPRTEMRAEEEIDEVSDTSGLQDSDRGNKNELMQVQSELRIPEGISVQSPSGAGLDASPAAIEHYETETALKPGADASAGETREEPQKFDEDKFRSELPERIGQTTRHNKKFHDFMVLYEIGKEIVRAETRNELYDVILFSVMGQIGTSSASIIIPDENDRRSWAITDSRGIVLKNSRVVFNTETGILAGILGKRDIVDLDSFKNLPDFEEEYYRLISVDARLLCPLTTDGRTLGAIVVGEKITIGDFTDAEKDFMVSIAEIAAMVLKRISALEELQRFSNAYRDDIGLNSAIGDLMNTIAQCNSIESASTLMQDELLRLGLQSYALFIRSDKNDEFVPILMEKEDLTGLAEYKFRLALDHPLISYLLEMKEGSRIQGFNELPVMRSTFPESIIQRISQLWIFPYKSGGMILGFMAVFRLEDREFPDGLHLHLDRLSRLLISYMINMRFLGNRDAHYTDIIEPVIRRVQRSFESARGLGIPFTLVLFSIKNFKRYFSLYGHEDAAVLVERCEQILSSRLSDTDFAIRMERNKFLIVLPGKNKKFAITFANTIRNEIGQHFRKKEMQLMLMYLTAEYPEDGEDLYALLDGIE